LAPRENRQAVSSFCEATLLSCFSPCAICRLLSVGSRGRPFNTNPQKGRDRLPAQRCQIPKTGGTCVNVLPLLWRSPRNACGSAVPFGIGKDSIDHAPGGNDDIANCVAGLSAAKRWASLQSASCGRGGPNSVVPRRMQY
jgi:hypothetical protein